MSTTQHDNSAYGNPEHVADLIVRYYDDALSPDELALLREALMQSASARDWFVRWGLQVQVLGESLTPHYREEQEQDPASDASALGAVPDTDQSYAQLLQELAQLEAQVEPAMVRLDAHDRDTLSKRAARPSLLPARRDVALAAGYVLHHAVMTKAAAMTALAALILIALLVLAPWQGLLTPTTNPATPNTAQVPDTIATKTPVATITKTHNAKWSTPGGPASAGPQTGDPLTPGQRLNLTAGFAEITTNRGAIAILEAPATIELLNNNAIRLHTGKLVGICETDSSKGFIVRTPHLDITDLGTRFGVDATYADATEVHVLEGEVDIASAAASTTAQRLFAGESVRASTDDSQLARIDFDQSLFNTPAFDAIAPFGTGQGLAVGSDDPNWQIIAIDGESLDQPFAAVVENPVRFDRAAREDLRFMPNVPSRSQWVTPIPKRNPKSIQKSVHYQGTFDLGGLDPEDVAMQLRFVADRHVAAIKLNGRPLEVPAHGDGPAYTEMTQMMLREGLVPGRNTLTVVIERYRTDTVIDFWTGMRMEIELTDRHPRPGPAD